MQNNMEKNEQMRKLIKSNSHTQITIAQAQAAAQAKLQ